MLANIERCSGVHTISCKPWPPCRCDDWHVICVVLYSHTYGFILCSHPSSTPCIVRLKVPPYIYIYVRRLRWGLPIKRLRQIWTWQSWLDHHLPNLAWCKWYAWPPKEAPYPCLLLCISPERLGDGGGTMFCSWAPPPLMLLLACPPSTTLGTDLG